MKNASSIEKSPPASSLQPTAYSLQPTAFPSNFDEAVRFLESRINYETFQNIPYPELAGRLKQLQKMLREMLGDPTRGYRTVHVAGTKGKGSTVAMIDSIAQNAGRRVGRFTSPHLYSFLERFTIDGVPCPKNEFAELMLELRDKIAAWDEVLLRTLTYFELTTLFAFEWFAWRKVDLAVVEVGLGGRFDATNICLPDLSVITSISFDHMDQLGETLEKIAYEKGGIIKPGVPVLSAVEDDPAKSTIRQIAKDQNAPVFFLRDAFDINVSKTNPMEFEFSTKSPFPITKTIGDLRCSMPGTHQNRNAALAVAAMLLLGRNDPTFHVDDDAVRKGLADAALPIRIEVLNDSPVLIVDGAHNRDSIQALTQTIRERFSNHRKTLIFGVALGKDVRGMLEELIPVFDRIILTQHSSSPRRFPPDELLSVARSISNDKEFETADDGRKIFRDLWNSADPADLLCVTGSMYLAAELRLEISGQ